VTSPFFSSLDSIATPFGTWIKPGGRVAAYVRSTGLQEGDDLFAMSGNLVASINEGCKRCRSGKGDIVLVLEGHTESLAVADSIPDLVAGTRIVSAGRPGASNNPTLTWTATASSLLLNVADVTIEGFNLVLNGIDGVVAAITATAAGCALLGNHITLDSASAGVLKAVEVSTGANRFSFIGNNVVGLGEAQPLTSAVVLVSAAVDDVRIAHNYIAGANPGTSVLGLIAVTAAATNVRIENNTLVQLESVGTADFAITVGAVAATGSIHNNRIKTASAAVADVSGISVDAAAQATMGLFENYVVGPTVASGLLSPDPAAGT
jgi:hypothetical protein